MRDSTLATGGKRTYSGVVLFAGNRGLSDVKRKLWISALVLCSWQYAMCEVQRFGPGDYVEVMDGASWRSCIVSGKYRPETRDYLVSCGAKEIFAPSGAAYIRSRKPT